MFQARIHLRGAFLVTLLAASACGDKNVPDDKATPSKGSEVPRDSGSTTVMSSGVVAISAGSDTAALPLPARSRRDSVALESMTRPDSALDSKWPVKMPAPLAGAILPTNRIIAYYGNPLEKRMGALGEYQKDTMLAMLDKEVRRWARADPATPVIPALHMVVTTAQGAPGKNGLYRLRMRDSLVSEVHGWAKSRKALFFVDIQLGLDDIRNELPRLRPILENPDVHLALDPEFAMAASGKPPGKKIGTMDAKEINWAVNFLDEIARAKNLPPKILIIHRFTRPMVTNTSDIKYTPHVQVVMHMDGWGPPWLKFDSYRDYVKKEPVQFTGFKIFYKNDSKGGSPVLTPMEVLRLNPRPLYIQYQ